MTPPGSNKLQAIYIQGIRLRSALFFGYDKQAGDDWQLLLLSAELLKPGSCQNFLPNKFINDRKVIYLCTVIS
jgi:hypothetical protein